MFFHVMLAPDYDFFFHTSRYITYSKEEEAVRCIQSVHGYVLDGRFLRQVHIYPSHLYFWAILFWRRMFIWLLIDIKLLIEHHSEQQSTVMHG